jgi:two-component system phosphate regulon sensor histidine kinase PhoR
MKGRIFRRVFILYIVILLLSVSFINLYLTRVLRSSYIDSLKESLAVQTAIAADITPFTVKADYDSFCRDMKEKTAARVTIIDTKGTVLGDSDSDASKMENHADRPEIQQALGLPAGSAIRFSDTLKYELL